MRLSRVKLTGFKSFVDPVELRVLPGLTGVVGPNGCGKSNLLEAIRWAMGEGSAKSLRGGAMEDVIFAGTASRPQRQFAEVAILATNENGEVEVVRRIERGAGSAYRINGRDVRARDAQLLFADAATGAHSPALVSQGRIGSIIAAKPAERRQMLEEAAGISGLHVRRREAEIRLKATETNLEKVAQSLAELENRAAVLRRQARSAERYRRLTDELRLAEARLIFARWRDANDAARAARDEAVTAEALAASAAEAQRAAAAWAREAADRLATLRSTAQTLRDAAAEARHAQASAEAERNRIEARLAELGQSRRQLEADRAREGELAGDAADAIARLTAEAEALDAAISNTAASRPALATRLADADREVAAAELSRANALAAQARADAERRVAEAARAASNAALERAQSDHDRLAREAAALMPLADAEAAAKRAQSDRQAAEIAQATANGTIAAQQDALTAAAAAVGIAQPALSASRATLAAAESEARALASSRDAGEGVLKLIRVDSGYEAALAAALDSDLDAGLKGIRRWAGGGADTAEPPLQAGEPLAKFVAAPPQLARRLAQIAVVERDEDQPLGPGQRLVTRDGRMRRWDGFIADEAGQATAETLRRRNRLAMLDTELPGLRDAVAAADAALSEARGAEATAATVLAQARRDRDAADAALRHALRTEDAATAEFERLTARHAELADRIQSAAVIVAAAEAAAQDACIAVDALPSSSDGAALGALDAAVAEARRALTALNNDLAGLDNRLTVDRARMAQARKEAEDWRARSGAAGRRVAEMDKRAASIAAEAEKLEADPRRASQAGAALAGNVERTALASAEGVRAEVEGEAVLREREDIAAKAGEALAEAREARAGGAARAENEEARRIEMGRVSAERFQCPAPVLPEKLGFDEASVGPVPGESATLERATLERERLGPVNLVAETELEEVTAQLGAQADEIAELTEATARLRGSIGSLNREGRQRLRAAFEAVDGHFRRLFATLFNGGEAHLALIDSDDPLEAGLEIMAQPPGKKLSSLTLLSGGEQALTAVALIFALFLTNPAPLCVLDEVDAPLDDANVERFCDLLDRMAADTDTRFLVVTHNALTMSRMHRLYGVTMVEQGISRLVSVDLGGATELLAAE
ncbi:Chromosome partition protein Smc [Sphingomonas antarctica]|uniref:chromosome segregation SMC family protein n=1 Tax=Sphingomonas antarctica TaxID=2040274 RepID=UPI0039E92FCE